MTSASSLNYLDSRKGRVTNHLPLWILVMAVGLVVFAGAAVLFGRSTGRGLVQSETGQPLAVRDVIITRTAGDLVEVTDVVTGKLIASYPADTGGFIRGSLRAFERMREVGGVPMDAPWRIIKWDSGRVSLSDTATGQRFYIEAFGRDNAAAFAALLVN